MLIEQTNYPQREINYGNVIMVSLLVLTTLAIIVKMNEKIQNNKTQEKA
jgi:hypothetical protein